jgi:hypothetical protein
LCVFRAPLSEIKAADLEQRAEGDVRVLLEKLQGSYKSSQWNLWPATNIIISTLPLQEATNLYLLWMEYPLAVIPMLPVTLQMVTRIE